jgi:hypothetical protein
MRRNILGIVVVLAVMGLGGCSTGGPEEPRVTEGMWIENAYAGLFFPSPDGEQAVTLEGRLHPADNSWCIADLPAPDSVGDVLPVTIDALSVGTPQLRCTDSPFITSPRWSPEGSRIAAQGQESTPDSQSAPDVDQTKLYVLDPSSLEIETIMDIGGPGPAVWVSETEILYYRFEPQEAWYVASVDGDELRTISAPLPGGLLEPVLVGDSTVVYRTDRREALADPEAVEVADLIELDWKTGTSRELAPLKNLNPDGQVPDPGFVTDMTADLRYAVLWAETKANQGRGPNVYVYDLESQTPVAHTPPGVDPQEFIGIGGAPYLVGDAWIAYSAIDSTSGESEFHLNVYIAPLDDPSAGIELFQDGLLFDVHNDRLTIAAGSGGLAILDMDF